MVFTAHTMQCWYYCHLADNLFTILAFMLAVHDYHNRPPRRPIKVAVLGSPDSGRSRIVSRLSLGSMWSICGPDGEDEYLTGVTSPKSGVASLEFTMVRSTKTDNKDDSHRKLVRNSDAFMLAYDVTDPCTLDYVKAAHRRFFGPLETGKPIWVCARGSFKPLENQRMSTEEGERFSEEIGAEFRCISVKEKVGLDEMFAQEVAHRIFPHSIPALQDTQGPSEPCFHLGTV
ncbi:hypothetical protein EDB81DRAFT_773871, partial [Dactylonectria macrodidyma]